MADDVELFPEYQCGLCMQLFRILCDDTNDPRLCQLYEDYATGQITGEEPLERAIEIAGWERFNAARDELIRRGVLASGNPDGPDNTDAD